MTIIFLEHFSYMIFAKVYTLLGILWIHGFDKKMCYFLRLKTTFSFKSLIFWLS